MTARSTWIERGPDGRPYFVRKKSNLPSTRQIFSQTLLRRSARSLFSSRDSRQNHHVQCVNAADGELVLPAPTSPNPPAAPSTHPTAPMAPTSQPQPQPVTMYLLPPQHGQNHLDSRQKSSSQEHATNPPSQFIPAPTPPGIFPIGPFPPHPMAPPPPNFFAPPMQFPSQPQSFLATPPAVPPGVHTNTVPAPTQPYGPQIPLPGPIPTHGEARYKCEICGRYRSARYHYKHPIQPGQLPSKTICRKCREEATDTEEADSSDSVQSRRSRHYHSRAPSRRRVSTSRSQRHRSRSRARSRGHPKLIDYDYGPYRVPSYTDSSSSSHEEEPHSARRRRNRRPGNADAGLVRRIRRLRLSPLGERTYYDDDCGGRGRNYEDDFKDREYDGETVGRLRSRSRQPTPGPRILQRQYSDPFVRTPSIENPATSRQPYFWGPLHAQPREGYSPQRGPISPRSKHPSMTIQHATHRSRSVGDSENAHEADQRRPIRLRSRSAQRGRDHDRHMMHEDEDDIQEENGRLGIHAPSPPPIRSSSLGYIGAAEFGEGERRQARSGRGRRRRSRSRSREDEHSRSGILRPGDELTVIERHELRARGDYDWYDGGGMRVRVREISR
ncbi:uncharacterized protein A1O5_02307 [Cladophialophora psammophila CBS 110553]|uniref:Uncharacterized protein n=1 Tax=Cladophialophora psammophila CBS 110553 TaxID=1182543 RepID=W9X1G1_9EURO|nr:uncharacterized protein A1O5_02307 [Cladophialophora psammophila CBS 110553]EXJ74013.1 hypothetical protein A1O5_02307 [Cladophialophora psammophila CBS 110553]